MGNRKRKLRDIRILCVLAVIFAGSAYFFLAEEGLGGLLQWWLPDWLWRAIDKISDPEGIRAVMTATGAVCFALTYINTAREKRIRGVLMERVIRYHYPLYGVVFLFHFIFAALGQYSCVVGQRTAGALCLLGLLGSLLYTVMMTRNVVFSTTRSEQMVSKYIMGVVESQRESLENQMSLVFQVAQYVARSFLENSLPFEGGGGRGTPAEKQQEKLIRQMLRLCAREADLPEGDILKQFEGIFREKPDMPPVPEEAKRQGVLYALPEYRDSTQRFQKSILLFDRMWRSLLVEIKEPYMQVELVWQVLYAAGKEERAALCCGLIVYLRENRDGGNGLDRDAWMSAISFLSGISALNHAYRRINKAEHFGCGTGENAGDLRETIRAVQVQCRDMIAVLFCLALLDQANSQENVLTDDFFNTVKVKLEECASVDAGVRWGQSAIEKYLCYANAVYEVLAGTALQIPTRRDMSRIIPAVTAVVQEWLA